MVGHFSEMEPMIDAVFLSSTNPGADCIQVYDGATGTQLKSYRGVPAAPATLAPVGQAAYIMSSQRDKPFLQAWSVNRHESLQMRLVVPGRVNALAISPKGPKYCVLGIGEKIYIYKLLSGRFIGVSSRHYQGITRLAFTACGNYFASAGEDGFVYLWRMADFNNALHKIHPPNIQPHFILGQHSDKVTDVTITCAGMRGILVSCSLDHTARVYDLVTGHQVYNLVTAGPLTAAATNTLGSQIFLGRNDGSVSVVNLLPPPPTGDVQVGEMGVPCHEKSVRCMAVTALGNQLVTGGEDGEVKVWTVTDTNLGRDAPSHPHLALHRTIHTGRGPITNLIISRMEREALNTADLNTKEVIAPFSQDHSNTLNAPVTVTVRGRTTHLQHNLELISATPNTSSGQIVNKKGTTDRHEDLLSTINQLRAANSQLYKFALKHIIDSD